MDTSISLDQFFDLLETGELSPPDIYKFVKTYSENFDVEILKRLLVEVEFQKFTRRNEFIDQNQTRIINILSDYTAANKKMPVDHVVTKDGKKLGTILDYDKLLNSEITFRFLPFRQLEGLIQEKLNNLSLPEIPKRSLSKSAPYRGLEHFLSEEGIKYFSIIKKACQLMVLKKKDLISFLFALEDLGLLNQKVNSIEISAIWRALTTTFGKELVGKRGNLSKYRNIISPESEIGKGEIRPFKNYINNQIFEAEEKASTNN